jgi:hypothetical protein
MTADGAGSPRTAELASHMKQLGEALSSHAARTGAAPGQPGHIWQQAPLPMPHDPGTGRQHREDSLLTALLQRHPESRQVLAFLPVAAFADPYCQELFQAIRSLDAAGRPIDPLTVDWELARRGVPLDGGTESYATRLARADAGKESPIKAATVLLERLDRRTTRAVSHLTGLFPQPAQARVPAPRHPGPHPRLIQPPPGTTAPNADPEPRT